MTIDDRPPTVNGTTAGDFVAPSRRQVDRKCRHAVTSGVHVPCANAINPREGACLFDVVCSVVAVNR